MSCATCHDPEKAWADGRKRALGRLTELRRNTPSLYNGSRNLAINFFWDGRADRLDDAILEAMTSRAEMNLGAGGLERLAGVPGYRRLQAAAFPGAAFTLRQAAQAIAAFVKAEVSVGLTPFDRFRDDASALGPCARRGLVLFVGKARCLECHAGPFFSDESFRRNGLAPDAALDDPGRYAVDADPSLWRAFKTPPLRNVALTAPYMHDGRLPTLEAVVEFYDRGGDDLDADAALRSLGLASEEKADLVAFLEALTGPRAKVRRPSLP